MDPTLVWGPNSKGEKTHNQPTRNRTMYRLDPESKSNYFTSIAVTTKTSRLFWENYRTWYNGTGTEYRLRRLQGRRTHRTIGGRELWSHEIKNSSLRGSRISFTGHRQVGCRHDLCVRDPCVSSSTSSVTCSRLETHSAEGHTDTVVDPNKRSFTSHVYYFGWGVDRDHRRPLSWGFPYCWYYGGTRLGFLFVTSRTGE